MREGTFVRFRILIHRDWKKTWVSDVCWVLIHRDSYELIISDVFMISDI